MMKNKKKKLNYKRVFLAIVALIAMIALVYFGISNLSNNSSKQEDNIDNEEVVKEEAQEEVVIPDDITITLAATGDIMCHSTNFKAAYQSDTGEYDFSSVFVNVAKYLSNADIAIGNLETTFAGEERGYSGYPTFNSPAALGVALKNIGIDVVTTANNHCMDKGYSGLVSTLDTLDEIGLVHTGTARSEEEQNTILVQDVNGIKIAFLSFTYGTNGITIPEGKEYSVNLIDKELILEQINLAKQEEVDVICVSMHWGDEYAQTQNSEQEELANYLFENGVDIIIGNHPHVLEPMEKKEVTLEDGTTKEVFVVYSLGNFVSGQTIANTKSTAILNIQITKNGETGKISIDSVDYVPVYCYDKGKGAENRYELIDIREAITEYESSDTSNISTSLYNTLKTEITNITTVLGEAIN